MKMRLRKTWRYSWFCFLLTVFVTAHASAELFTFTLPQMVEKAELIVMGDVVKLERSGKIFSFFEGKEVDRYVATVGIVEILKGDPTLKEISVEFRLHPEEPQFKIGERAVLFLQKYKDGLRVFPGLHGQVKIIESPSGELKVRPIFIFGEPKEESLALFVKKIRGEIK